MPIWERYQVEATVSYKIKSGEEFIFSGLAPGVAVGGSNRGIDKNGMSDAAAEALAQATERAMVAIVASEDLRRKELGYKDGD